MIQSVSFRLGDSLPADVVVKWKNELGRLPPEERNTQIRLRIEEYLDAGRGECWLNRAAISTLVEDALLYFDGKRYRLLAWCVMPNHVHTLVETRGGFPLAEVVHSWKSFTGHEANKILQREGEFWEREYFDRYVRDAEHYQQAVAYIEENPVKARLVKIKTDWAASSARFRSGSAAVPAAS